LKEVPLVDSLEDSLLNYLQNKFGMRPNLDDSLAMLGVDSVSMAELTFEIEKMYGITVDEMMSVETVENLLDYIRERQNTAADKS
jgi:acyl carrier protein